MLGAVLRATLRRNQALLLTLCSGVTPVLGGPHWVPRIETELLPCKAKALPAVLSLWPSVDNNFKLI